MSCNVFNWWCRVLTLCPADIYFLSSTYFLFWHRFNYDVGLHTCRSMTVLQVLLTYANVCPLFTLQFCSLLHFRRSIAFGLTFSTPYTPVPRFPFSHFQSPRSAETIQLWLDRSISSSASNVRYVDTATWNCETVHSQAIGTFIDSWLRNSGFCIHWCCNRILW